MPIDRSRRDVATPHLNVILIGECGIVPNIAIFVEVAAKIYWVQSSTMSHCTLSRPLAPTLSCQNVHRSSNVNRDGADAWLAGHNDWCR